MSHSIKVEYKVSSHVLALTGNGVPNDLFPFLYRAVLTEREKVAFDEAVEGVLEEHVNSAAAARWREWGDLRLYGDFVNVHGFYTELDRGAAMDYVRRAARRLDRDRRRREGRESAAPGDLVITRNKVELFCRMRRILMMPGGHLVGLEFNHV